MVCHKRRALSLAVVLAGVTGCVLFVLLGDGQLPVHSSGQPLPEGIGQQPSSSSGTKSVHPEADTWTTGVVETTGPRKHASLARTWPSTTPVSTSRARDRCGLPAGGRWATVELRGLPPFPMAVYAMHDVVSEKLRTVHRWEMADPAVYGRPGHAMDIGGNLGIYSLSLAKAGWNVTTWEPMPANLKLLRASLCANSEVAPRIDLHEAGLSDVAETCRMVSDRTNTGDGTVMCRGENVVHQRGHHFVVRGSFEMKVLDEELPKLKFADQQVGFVKVDVEGFECHVWRGARELLKQRPRLIQSEVWGEMQNCTPTEYLKLFRDAGYQIKKDARCRTDARWTGPLRKSAIEDYFLCRRD
ncbi:unnamed protein product [Symbiodinium natans]|uniref:Methyltransferase FkbM domain-containing protein n=1 Tax=Symbiodinium natans TaxID=878477 RepID=A0A812P246_9DINO|nr:unnamed protein product [Symbiodinium natans]